MPKILKIGIAGCGAIGSSLAQVICNEFSARAELSGLYDIDAEKASFLADKLNNPKLAVLNLEGMINRSDLVIEAAKADSSLDIARKAVSLSKDVMVMSVGGIAQHYKELRDLAQEHNVKVYIPSGAVCGIDGLKAAACGKIKKVILTTKKPPKAFLGVLYVLKQKIRLDNITNDTVIFEGSAASAAKFFPQNINVAATLSLAGIGLENTIVRIVASPGAVKNIHEIEIESNSGTITTRTENIIHPDNPKTSYLAVLSAIAVLRQILEPIKVGT